ncbi:MULTISPECIES: hypothetical protein [Cobetia]|uniref:Carboxypeptidase regulatory-like domain-containing protein n=1 Tax=Cobetia crustatorum TaxID=553385 RepID=A0A558HKF8_9GAMM|nr:MULTISPECIES: hypothetical protein [Cobetia]TVU69615.1 carboxypeptidase regulatory-like domain-containing protein [Cobetia crustatorum]
MLRQLRTPLALLLCTAALAGCESATRIADSISMPDFGITEPSEQRVERTVAFPEAEYAELEKTGSSAIKGRMSYDWQGQTVYANGDGISVAPVTTYSAEAAELALSGKTVERADSRAQAYTHIVRTDSNGYFNATGLPSGTFYVAGVIKLPDGTRSPLILSQVQVGRGQTRSIELSR